MKTVFITGADRGLGLGLVKEMLKAGHKVFAGQYMPDWPELAGLQAAHPGALFIIPLDVGSMESVKAAAKAVEKEAEGLGLDMLINNAAVAAKSFAARIRGGLDYADMLRVYDVNALGCLRATEAFLPLMEKGAGKRLCYVSSEAGSIGRSHRDSLYGYCMSKSALNMAVSILFNDLRKDGYTFRLYYPGWIRSYMGGAKSDRGDMEPDEAAVPAAQYFLSENGAYDEDRLVMRDYLFQDWPW
jgi:NAD(P)-dependent dehydrogenase (short-subunit alcohol dehydrogenase family)